MNKHFKYIMTLLMSVLLLCLVSCPNDVASIASFKDYKIFTFQRDHEIDPSVDDNTFVIVLKDYKFSDAVAEGVSVLSDGLAWITAPADVGLSFKIVSVNQDRTEATVAITGTPTKVLNSVSIEGEIAKDQLIDANGNTATTSTVINTRASKITINPAGKAILYTDTFSIVGDKGEKLDDFYEFTIYADNVSFNAITASSTDINSWFGANENVGLKFALKENVSARAKSLTVSVTSDALTKGYTGELKITVPSDVLSVGGNLSVDTKGSTIDISEKKPTWQLYDLASFGTVDLQMKSPNQNLTKNEDGSDINFKGTLIAKGSDNTVKYEKGLSRRGYKLKGFAVPGVDGNVDINNVTYPVATANIKNGFTITATPDAITKLYAIWEVDPTAWGWTLKEDGTYQKTQDISGYNAETGENAYFPATFNLKKSGISEADQAKYQDYPYYKEAKILSKGMKAPGTKTAGSTDYSDLDDVDFTYDFAIGEQMVTGYMLDVLREWNKGTGSYDSPEKGYELPTEAIGTAPSGTVTKDNNTVGYGTSYATGSYLPNNEKSDPITWVTVSQGIVISNALTAYYNEKNASTEGFSALTFAYIKDGGTDEIKTIADADTLVGKSTAANYVMFKSGNTGFRLPTQNEWTLASRIVPESGYDKSLTGAHAGATANASRNYMYPQIHRSNMWSGSDVIASEVPDNPLSSTWVWNYYSVSTQANRTTHGFLKTSKDGSINNWTVIDKKPNNIGVYGMSGNVWEWCDTTIGTSGFCRLRGSSFASNAANARVGYLGSGAASGRDGDNGLRLARLIQISDLLRP